MGIGVTVYLSVKTNLFDHMLYRINSGLSKGITSATVQLPLSLFSSQGVCVEEIYNASNKSRGKAKCGLV